MICVFFSFLCFKICLLIGNHCKRWNVFSDLPKITYIFWTFLRVHKVQNCSEDLYPKWLTCTCKLNVEPQNQGKSPIWPWLRGGENRVLYLCTLVCLKTVGSRNKSLDLDPDPSPKKFKLLKKNANFGFDYGYPCPLPPSLPLRFTVVYAR